MVTKEVFASVVYVTTSEIKVRLEAGEKADDVRREKLWSIRNTEDNFEMKWMCRMKPRGWIHQPSEHSDSHSPD